ncbi:short-chain dehydrogenase [Paraburkholderia steynii]|uniref:Short-chain dehydrogenase n=1 Tax=Paraburkholderia steynii TaxID=1245441 RepID=A0A4R0XCF5_9BURK|nr:short-chain dehydrogenase [Paraburkholderia steynii]
MSSSNAPSPHNGSAQTNQYDFTQRAAVITGGAQGIGYAVAQHAVRSVRRLRHVLSVT